jgi:thiol:disulfide interchange protein DsbD
VRRDSEIHTTHAATALALLGLFAPSAHAVGVEDLLPVDQAYVLSAKAVSRERVEFAWTIAPGYYLYRHRFAVAPVDAAFKANPLQLPDGAKHHDQFFGDVETYRDSVTAVLTGAAADATTAATFKVKYQGCADVGVCYPPQTRTITVAMPAALVGGVALVGGASAPTPMPAVGAEAPPTMQLLGDVLPLPEDEASRFRTSLESPPKGM